MGKIIAVANQKGGVGKTTTSVNLAASLAASKHRSMLIDVDPQGNATMGCGIDKSSLDFSIYDVLMEDVPAAHAIHHLPRFDFDLLPSNADVTAAEVELMAVEKGRERRLDTALQPIRDNYEFVIIDCPPSLNLLTLNALVAADSVLIPMQCEYYALEGLSALMETLQNVRKSVNPSLALEGLLRTMFDARSRLTKDVSDQLEVYFDDKVFRTFIPRNIRLAEAPSHGMPVIQYDKSSRGAKAYLALAGEIVRRNSNSDQG